LESPATLLNNSVVRYLYDLPIDYWDRYPERIMLVTPKQVQDVATRYLDSDRLQVIAVGNGEEIASMLQSFGAVEVYDDQGVFVETIGVSR
jgi:predicted Zn-dependent peptidase